MDSDLLFLQAFGKIFLQANLLIIIAFFLYLNFLSIRDIQHAVSITADFK
jgi:hypothetical protein